MEQVELLTRLKRTASEAARQLENDFPDYPVRTEIQELRNAVGLAEAEKPDESINRFETPVHNALATLYLRHVYSPHDDDIADCKCEGATVFRRLKQVWEEAFGEWKEPPMVTDNPFG